MRPLLDRREGYSRAETISDAAVHMAGLVAVMAGVPALILAAMLTAEGSAPVAATILYGMCFAAMIAASAAYNMSANPDREWLLKRLDHSAIYLKIAGTVTAFALIAGQGTALALGLWSVATIGILLKMVSPYRFRRTGLALYLGMGWAVSIWGWGMFAALPAHVSVLIATAGILYTVGVIFYLWERLPFHQTIWHAFVLVSSLLLYVATFFAVTA